MLNLFSKFCLLCSSFAEPKIGELDTDGWVAISPVTKMTHIETGSEKDDFSIWPLFTKKLGGEKLRVRFPSNPTYHFLSSNELEIKSFLGESSYFLRVLNPVTAGNVEEQVKGVFLQPEIVLAEVNRTSDHRWDVMYRKDGKWICQTYLLQGSHFYFFQSENPFSHRENHNHFVSSLSVIS